MKQFFDIIFSFFFLIIISPIFVLIGILIKIETKGPIFFISERIGVKNKRFKMIKFRTMYIDTEIVETDKLKNLDNKITKVGRYLRKYSIDEIPQFFSVIFGTMSIVGPRPALPSQNDLIKKREELGINVLKPGITGYAQINGRDLISIDKKLSYEREYLKKRSFIFDLEIIIKTVVVVLTRRGILH